ncbi:MAG: hypothetical protein AVDCRST_MAG41-2946, partial [uncultured Corynebacteriales bacterium]
WSGPWDPACRRTVAGGRRTRRRWPGRPRRDVRRAGDLVVAVCDSAHEELGPAPDRLHRSVPVRSGPTATSPSSGRTTSRPTGSTGSPPQSPATTPRPPGAPD